jgi:hypothetical protein
MRTLATLLLTICTLPAMAQLKASTPNTNLNQTTIPIDSTLIGYPTSKSSSVYTPYHIPAKMAEDAVYMVDSVKVNRSLVNYLDLNQVLDISTNKSAEYPKGLIFIKLKNVIVFEMLLHDKFLSLNDITNKYISETEKHKPVLYLLDKELLTDTAGIRIPEMCLANITVAKASETPYFKTAFPGISIMMITTRPASTEPYKSLILLTRSSLRLTTLSSPLAERGLDGN